MQDILIFMQQHWELSSILVVALVLLIILEFIKQKGGGNRLNPAQATALINHQNAVVIDVRSTDAFANGHIIGAVSIPFKELETKLKKVEKYKTQPIVLVCGTGSESQRAALLLAKQGYQTYYLNGGLRMWQEAELPLVEN